MFRQGFPSKAARAVHVVPPSVDKRNCRSDNGGKRFARFCIGLHGEYIQNVFNRRSTKYQLCFSFVDYSC